MIANIRISGAQTFPYSESDIRVNINDTSKIIAAANANVVAGGTGQGQFWSSNGGFTWSQTNLSLNTGDEFHSDPAVDWTTDGTAWAITIGFDAAQTHLRLRAFKSTDGGATWTYDADASGAQTNTDKELMWVDKSPTSSFKDNIYVIWHNGAPVFVNRRTGPSGSWQTPVQVSGTETTGTGIGGDITTNSFGDVFAFWPDTGSMNLFVAKSTDGGANFGAPVTIATTFDSFGIGIPSFAVRQPHILLSGGAFRTAAKDLVYVVWMDLTGATGCTAPGNAPGTSVTSACKTRIWFARSTDGGATWGTPVMINDQASKNDQFNPRMAVDATNGQIAVMYYDTVGDTGRLRSDVWMQTSDDDGVTWRPAFRVTSAQTDETGGGADTGGTFFGVQYGDYNGLTGHAGTFFPCWTDRRSGAREEIWTAPVRTVRDSFLIVDRSTFGEDEVLALLSLGTPAVINDAFWVVVEGFTAAELGLTTANLGSPPTVPTVTFAPGLTAISAQFVGPVVPEDATLPPTPQRFRYAFQLSFASTADFGFTGDVESVTLQTSLTSAGVTVTAGGLIQLIKKANPYLLDGPVSWLSIDLRVFKLATGQSRFGVSMGTDGPSFIQSVLTALNAGGGSAGGDTFDGLATDENASALELSPTDAGGTTVFDFAVARVRMRGLTQDATNTRVFFRLFQAQTTNVVFDRPVTTGPGADPAMLTYRRFWDGTVGGQAIALLGIKGGEYVTLPCFASPRVDTATGSMTAQTDAPNVRTIVHDPGGAEVQAFFGCWLDVNQPARLVLPASPPAGNPDGPFSGPLLSIQQAIVRSPHQCLVAEIAFDPDAIPLGVDPSTTDKLAQRNLAWVSIPNPGFDDSRRVPQPFELRASGGKAQQATEPDELMIDWGDLPSGSRAQIYLPAVGADRVLELARELYTTRLLQRIDEHTLGCAAETDTVTYLPVPAGTGADHAGLLTVDIPEGVRRGELYQVQVRQLTRARARLKQPTPGVEPAHTLEPTHVPQPGLATASAGRGLSEWRRVFGGFRVNIPVHTRGALLPGEERRLSILRYIAQAIPHSSRWYPIFVRYLEQLGGRVRGLGGDPGAVLPSPTGEWGPVRPTPYPGGPEEVAGETGKVVGLIYDRFGDFDGFVLETERGEQRRYRAREHEVEDLVRKAWEERAVIAVRADPHGRPQTIVVQRAPRPYQG